MTRKNRLYRVLALILCLCLTVPYLPVPGHAEGCGHVHGESCYQEVTQCVHTHGEDCWSDPEAKDAGEEPDACAHVCGEDTGCVTKELVCPHVHDDTCGEQLQEEPEPEPEEPNPEEPKPEEPEEPQEPKNEEPKQEEENQPLVISQWEWVDEEEILDPETGVLCLSAEEPILFEQVAELLPKAILATVGEVSQTVPLDHWDPQDYPQETGANSGSYLIEATLPEGYTLAEDAAPLTLHLEFAQAQALAECGHENVNMDTGKCPDCDEQVYVAKIGDTGYATLEDALTDAQKEENEGCTVTVLCNIDVGGKGYIITGGVLTLNLNGKEIKQTVFEENVNFVIKVVDADLTVIDTAQSDDVGTITPVSSNDALYLFAGKLTISGGTLNGRSSVSSDAGKLEILDGTFNGRVYIMPSSRSSISGGIFMGGITCLSELIINAIKPGYAIYSDEEKNDLVNARVAEIGSGKAYYVLDHVDDCNVSTCLCPCGRYKHTNVDINTGRCNTCQKQAYMAKIGSTGFATLEEALTAAQKDENNGCTVTVLKNNLEIRGIAGFIYNGKFTLDLNGKAVRTVRRTSEDSFLVIQGGSLTITDSAPGGATGEIANSDAYIVLNSGELVFENVKYGRARVLANGGNLSIRGGYFTGSSLTQFEIKRGAKATFSGGILEKTYGGKAIQAEGRSVVELLKPGYAFFEAGSLIDASGEILNNGKYEILPHIDSFGPDGKCDCGRVLCVEHNVDMATGECNKCRSQVYVAKIGDTGYATLGEALGAAQENGNKGCTVTMLSNVSTTEGYTISKGEFTLDLNGKIVRNRNGKVFEINGGVLTVKNGEITSQHASAIKIISGELTIAGGGVGSNYTEAPTVDVKKGIFRITDGIIGTSDAGYGLYIATDATAVICGGSFPGIKTDGKSVIDLVDDGYALYNENNNEIIDASGSEILWIGIDVKSHPTHTYNATTGKCPCGRTCAHTDVDMTTGKCNTCQKQLVAAIGNTGYATLGEALDAAQEMDTACMVTLLCDVREFYETIKGGKITLDLNGKKWNVGNTQFTIEGGELTLMTSKPNGKMAFKDSSIYVKEGKLTVYGGEYESAVECVIVEGGSLVISGGTFISRELAALSVGIDTYVELSGGSFSGGNKTAVADDRSAAELLAAGYAFYSDAEGNNIVDASGDTLSGTVYVLPNHPTHTYNPTTGKCPCGRTIPQATLDTAPATAKLTYNGQAQNLVTPGVVTGGKLMYSLTENGTYTETVPTGKKADTYTVWYYVLGTPGKYYNTEKQSLTVTVGKKDLTPVVTIQDQDFDGTKEVKHFTVALEGKEDGDDLTYTLGALEFDAAIPGTRSASFTGTPELKGKDAGNYDLKAPTGLTGKINATSRYLEVTDSLPNADTVTVDGEEYQVKVESGKCYVILPDTGNLLTVYTYQTNADNKTYPDTMRVFAIDRQDTGSTLAEIPEFENLLTYEGCSIRLNGTKGIRMITSIDQGKKKALVNSNLAGYTLVEYGTVITRENTLGGKTLNLGTGKSNYAYSRANKKDPVFKTENGRIQYTNVLVNFQPSDYKTELVLRPYIKLRDASGNEVVLYGGTVTRSIYYIAQQNLGDYKPGSAGYKYLQEILGQK